MKKWEYRSGSLPANQTDERLNDSGAHGWELVSVIVVLNGQVIAFF